MVQRGPNGFIPIRPMRRRLERWDQTLIKVLYDSE